MSGRAEPDPATVTARNLEVARAVYEGVERSLAAGGCEDALERDAFDERCRFADTLLGGERAELTWVDVAASAAAEHAALAAAMHDVEVDELAVWPNSEGCACRWRIRGTCDGVPHEAWEQRFLWVGPGGTITRMEVFHDWHGSPQLRAAAFGVGLDEATGVEGYGRPPFRPGPVVALHPPPSTVECATPRAARHLAFAVRYYDGHRLGADRHAMEGIWLPEDFRDPWEMFSGWSGRTNTLPADSGYPAVSNVEHAKIWQVLPDYTMTDFFAFPTDDGVAWRWCVTGHTAEGVRYEFWEQCFVFIGDDGTVTRFEFYDDWAGFPQTLGFASGLSLDELWHTENYLSWIMA